MSDVVNDCKKQRTVVMLTADRCIDRRILLEAKSLRSAGWDVRIIAMPSDLPSDADDLKYGVERVSRLNLNALLPHSIVLSIYGWLRSFIPMNGWMMRRIKNLSWRYLIDQETFYEKFFIDYVDKLRPSIFVAHDLPMLPLASKLAKLANAKLVYDSHELYAEQEFSAWERKRWFDIESRYIKTADLVMTVNQSIANELQDRYGLGKVEVIYNLEKKSSGAGVSRGLLHKKLGIDFSKKILLLQGGITAGRNIDVLVSSMALVRNINICLVILGDGQYLKNLNLIVKKLGLQDKVYFIPRVSQDELQEITVSADAGVIPYQPSCLNNYYCTPNKLFEFIAAGLPIIASDLPEISRIVKGNQIGMVGSTSTPEALASLIDNFFSDDDRFLMWISNGLGLKNILSWEAQEAKLLNLYASLD